MSTSPGSLFERRVHKKIPCQNKTSSLGIEELCKVYFLSEGNSIRFNSLLVFAVTLVWRACNSSW